MHFSLTRKKSFYFRYIFLFLKDISILETDSNLQYKYCSCSTKIAYDTVMWKPKIQYFISTVFHFLFYFNLHIFVDCILVSIRILLFLCLWIALEQVYAILDDIFRLQQMYHESNWYIRKTNNFFNIIFFYLQYYYSVRIFPGQEPANVWVGWITSDFHQYDTSFDLERVRTVTVTLGDEKGKVHERLVTIYLKCYIFHNSQRQLIIYKPQIHSI